VKRNPTAAAPCRVTARTTLDAIRQGRKGAPDPTDRLVKIGWPVGYQGPGAIASDYDNDNDNDNDNEDRTRYSAHF
jgi:hypothetical protein